MNARALAIALLAATWAVLAACSAGGDRTGPASKGTPVIPSFTGEAQLAAALGAALAPDTIEMARLTRYERVPCAPTEQVGHPQCRPDESPGTAVEVFLKVGCSPGWVRPEYVPELFAAALQDKHPALTAVYKPSPGVQFVRAGAEAVAVVETDQQAGARASTVALYMTGSRIVALEDCAKPPGLLDDAHVGTWLLRPGGAITGATPTDPTRTP